MRLHPNSVNRRETFPNERASQGEYQGPAGCRGDRRHIEVAVGWPQYPAGARLGPWTTANCRSACVGSVGVPSRRSSRRRVLRRADDPHRGQCRGLAAAIREQGGDCMVVELDLVSQDSIAAAFATIRREAGEPDVLIYNGLPGRPRPSPERNCSNTSRWRCSTPRTHPPAADLSSWPRKCCLPCGRRALGRFLLRTTQEVAARHQRNTSESLYYPRSHDADAGRRYTEEYSEHGVHVANVVIDGTIDPPGTRALLAGCRTGPIS